MSGCRRWDDDDEPESESEQLQRGVRAARARSEMSRYSYVASYRGIFVTARTKRAALDELAEAAAADARRRAVIVGPEQRRKR
ncbi:MAG: hypothetical protein Q7T01_00875 [bacterium]|nr:hypothetical protein [bacterium]